MKRTDIISYVAIIISVIALAVALFAGPCPKRDMRGPNNRAPRPEMVHSENNHRPDMRDNRGDNHRPDARNNRQARDSKSHPSSHNARPAQKTDAE